MHNNKPPRPQVLNIKTPQVSRDALRGDSDTRLQDFFHVERYYNSTKLFVSSKQGGLVLDAGCGHGYGCHILRTNLKTEVIGIDLNRNTIKYAKKKYPSPIYLVASVQQLPFKSSTVDAVFSFEVIEHVDDPDAMLKEIARVLRKSGRLIISTPNYFDLGQLVRKIMGLEVTIQWPLHKREFTYQEFLSKLVTKGFTIRKVWGQNFALGRIHGPFWLAVGLSRTFGRHMPFVSRDIILDCTRRSNECAC